MEGFDIKVLMTIIGFAIGIMGSLITIYVKQNVKNKESDMKHEESLDNYKNLKELIEKIYVKIDKIEEKIDKKFEVLTVLKAEHDQIKEKCMKNQNE